MTRGRDDYRATDAQLLAILSELGISPGTTLSGTREHPVAVLEPRSRGLDSDVQRVALGSTVATHTFCFQQATRYNDAGLGEDIWPEDGVDVNRPMAFALFTYADAAGANGYGLLDLFGCATFTNAPTGNWLFAIYSGGAIGTSNLFVYGKEPGILTYQDGHGTWSLQGINLPVYLATTTADPQLVPPFKAWLSQPDFNGNTSKPGPLNGYPALAAALFEHNTNAWTYRFTMDTDHSTNFGGGATTCDSSTSSSTTHGPAWRYPDHTFLDNKFQPTHELGHAVLCAATGSAGPDDTTYAGPNTCGVDSGHTESSIEYQGAAFAEGWANFYSAVTWNFDSPGADCRTGSDCAGNATRRTAYAKQRCSPLSEPAGCTPGTRGCNVLGVEWDWTREFWAVKTAPSQPSLNEMFEWIRAATPGMNKGNVYLKLDAAANSGNVSAAVRSAWNSTKDAQGVSAH